MKPKPITIMGQLCPNKIRGMDVEGFEPEPDKKPEVDQDDNDRDEDEE